jgi:hypothetical protein
VAVTVVAGWRSQIASPTRSQAIEFATGQATPMYGAFASTAVAGTIAA